MFKPTASVLILAAVFISCSGKKTGQLLSSAFTSVTYPDTVRPASGFNAHGYLGIYGVGGLADYLIHKPYNPNGVILDFGRDMHIKVSEEYQNQMHKYPSIDAFERDRLNDQTLSGLLQTCMDTQKDSLEVCDCTALKIQ